MITAVVCEFLRGEARNLCLHAYANWCKYVNYFADLALATHQSARLCVLNVTLAIAKSEGSTRFT